MENEKIYGRNDHAKTNIQSVSGKLSIIYDCINKLILNTKLGKFRHGEIDLALNHLNAIKTILPKDKKAITIFDRNYYSIELVNQMFENNQKFLIRMAGGRLERITDLVDIGEDKTFEVKFNTYQTSHYKNKPAIRKRILNSTYKLRVCKVEIIDINGERIVETLLTNIEEKEFDIGRLKELYHLRWNVETAYNVLKNRMKLEEFSGKRDTLVRQDIYSSVWVYNLVMLLIIECNEDKEAIEERYKYQMKINTNMAIGIFKTYFIKSIITKSEEEKLKYSNELHKLIIKYLVPVRPNRQYQRNTVVNKSRTSYKYTY